VARTRSEHLGESFAQKLFDYGEALLNKNKDQQKEDAKQAVEEMKAASTELTDEQKLKTATIAQEALLAVLLMNDIPSARAAEIAQQVSDVTTKILSPAE
jgi:hypothetical protein